MLDQAEAFREELEELAAALAPLSEAAWDEKTPFKQWSVWDVVAHLHWTDLQATLALRDAEAFRAAAREMGEERKRGVDLMEFTRRKLAHLGPADLLGAWLEKGRALCELLAAADPKARLPWYGPDMGVRMFATARQMETWAHGQDVYDLYAWDRRYRDRIVNIAVIGVKTFGWTFVNRGLEVPSTVPYVRLTAPSGAVWEWNAPNDEECVEGEASEFCHVVTQGRNLADTGLRVTGEVAERWMSIAQCFAGAPSDPPAPGVRTTRPAGS